MALGDIIRQSTLCKRIVVSGAVLFSIAAVTYAPLHYAVNYSIPQFNNSWAEISRAIYDYEACERTYVVVHFDKYANIRLGFEKDKIQNCP